MARAWAVVPAAGRSARMGGDTPKPYLPLCGRPLLAHALRPLLECARIEAVVLVVAPADQRWRDAVPPGARLLLATGGAERCHSVYSGLEQLADRAAADDWVLVHDAARPCLSAEELAKLFDTVADDAVGGLLAVPLTDTLKYADAVGRVERTAPRERLWRALTPQMFRFGLLRAALAEAISAGLNVTDEAAAIERAGYFPLLVAGRSANLKVTGPEDLELADAILHRRKEQTCE